MSLIRDLNALDKMAGIPFSDRASVMPRNRTRAPIAYTGNCDTFNGVVLGCDIDNLAAVACIVAETNNLWHG